MSQVNTRILLPFLLLAISTAPALGVEDFSTMRGANCVPSYARNDVQTWMDYDPALPAFDDAIATIAATLRADAGQKATHRWTVETKGSVRLVGQLQKITPKAAAEIRVLADGEPIWKRVLREDDSIPYGCDILACDLSNGSTVDLVVAADKDSPGV